MADDFGSLKKQGMASGTCSGKAESGQKRPWLNGRGFGIRYSGAATERAPDVDGQGFGTGIRLPAFLHGKMAEELARRFITNDWVYWSTDDCQVATLEQPEASYLLNAQKGMGMKRTHVADKSCAWCGISNTNVCKCAACLVTYYCDAFCQRAHWPQHKVTCKEPAPSVSNQYALVLPDYECCRRYVAGCQEDAAMPLL